jgi:hypothetical protein
MPPGSKIVKIDMTDFYMSGSIDQLLADVMSIFPVNDRCNPLRADTLRMLLYYQYIRGPAHDPNDSGAYRVLNGSGMGLVASGDISDAAFYARLERWSTSKPIVTKFMISEYIRFRDDCIYIARDMSLFHKFFEHILANKRYFTIKCEDVSSHSMIFLNLGLSVEHGTLSVQHAFKPTALYIPLSAASGQLPSTHRMWPRAMIRSIRELSTRSHAEAQVKDLKKRLSTSMIPFLWPDPESITTILYGQADPKPKIKAATMWIPITYHPELRHALPEALATYCRSNQALTSEALCLASSGQDSQYTAAKIAWKNGAPHFVHVVQRLARVS